MRELPSEIFLLSHDIAHLVHEARLESVVPKMIVEVPGWRMELAFSRDGEDHSHHIEYEETEEESL